MRRSVRSAAFVLVVCAFACALRPSALEGAPDGRFRGRATYRGAALALSVHFYGDGPPFLAELSSPDLMLLDVTLEKVVYTRPHVRFVTGGEHPLWFEGAFAGDSIVGTADVGAVPGVIAPRAPGDTSRVRFVLRRTSVPERPYATRQVSFASDTVTLGGTIYLPPGRPHTLPGVVILQGSSANLRQEYAFYADHFARAGFAVLAFDKRGHGESSGRYLEATYGELARDAAAALARLRAESRVAPSRVGLWGMSQGALLAPMVAARAESLAFVVAVSAPGVIMGECAAYQDSVRLIEAGFTAALAESAAAVDRRLLDWLRTGRRRDEMADELERVAETPWRRASSIPASLPYGSEREGWYWRGRTLDPLPSWRALRVPALVVFGAADELVPAPVSAANIERALRVGRNADHTVKTFPAANHVLKTLPLVAGGAWDWPRAAPGYLSLVTEWMRSHARPKP